MHIFAQLCPFFGTLVGSIRFKSFKQGLWFGTVQIDQFGGTIQWGADTVPQKALRGFI